MWTNWSGGWRERWVVAGLVTWVPTMALLGVGLAEAILLWGMLVVVPWGLYLSDRRDRGGRQAAATYLAALLAVFAFALPRGPLAAAFTVPWLLVTVVLAAGGILRLAGPRLTARELGFVGARLLVWVGGWGVLFSRAGLRPLGFSDEIVLLTGIHFHYAGFALPILAGLTAGGWPGRLTSGIVWGVLAGVPLVGVGITISAWLELSAVLLLAAACLLLAAAQLRVGWQTGRPAVFALLAVSSMSLLGAMCLAGVYAWGEFWQQPRLDIPTMVRLHGVANAFGFTICGLLAWTLLRRT